MLESVYWNCEAGSESISSKSLSAKAQFCLYTLKPVRAWPPEERGYSQAQLTKVSSYAVMRRLRGAEGALTIRK